MSETASPPPVAEEERPPAAPQAGTRREALADRAAAALCWLVGLGYLCRALKILAARMDVTCLWDDGLMFVRYAGNILKYGAVSWNPHGPPTYGLTSLLYMLVVVPMTALSGHNPALADECSSLLCGALFLAALVALVRRSAGAAGRPGAVITLLVLAPVAWHFRTLATHFMSGMDTMFALSYLCAYFLAFQHYERSPSRRGALAVASLGGLAFAARPDLLLYTMALPAALFVFAPGRRRQAGAILLASGALVLAQMAVCAVYFHSPLPLPFYVKGFHHYGGFPYDAYHVIAADESRQYARDYWPLAAVIAFGLWGRVRDWSPMNKGLLLATLAWLLYFRFFVVQIMPFDQRFFYPTLPALAALSAYSLGLAWERAKGGRAEPAWAARPAWRRGWFAAGTAAALALLPGVLLAPIAAHILAAKLRAPGFTVIAQYHQYYESLWFGLDSLSRLPAGVSIATTDVGIPSVLNPAKDVIDMAGLHETHFAHAPFRAAWLFDHYHPDWLYLPFPDYKQYNRDIAGSAYFRAHYALYPAAGLRTMTGVALWKDSPYYAQMRDVMRRQPPPLLHTPVPDTPIGLSLLRDRLEAHLR